MRLHGHRDDTALNTFICIRKPDLIHQENEYDFVFACTFKIETGLSYKPVLVLSDKYKH